MSDLADLIAQYAPSNAVSRQSPDADSSSALSEPYEQRVIVLAQGAYFNVPADDGLYAPTAISNLSNGSVSLVCLEDNLFFYSCDAQQIMYLLYITNDKSVFQEALGMENVMVIYAGHARHGQGACFHPEDTFQQQITGEWWGDGDGSDNGLVRMGYPYIAMPVKDVLDCLYHANPVPSSQDKPAQDSALLHPKLMSNYGAIKEYALEQLSDDPAAIGVLEVLLPEGPYWGLVCQGDDGKTDLHLVMNCGYAGTTTTPFDLDGANPQCQVFCYFGCSTLVHNYPVVRKLYGWTKDGDNHLAYWTDSPSPPVPMSVLWLYHLFSYNKATPTWEQACEYAKTKTNAQMPSYTAGSGNYHCKIV